MTVTEEIERIQSKIAAGTLDPDEEMFPLFAHDLLAAGAVTGWAAAARALKVPTERVESAMRTAAKMRAYPNKKIPGVRTVPK